MKVKFMPSRPEPKPVPPRASDLEKICIKKSEGKCKDFYYKDKKGRIFDEDLDPVKKRPLNLYDGKYLINFNRGPNRLSSLHFWKIVLVIGIFVFAAIALPAFFIAKDSRAYISAGDIGDNVVEYGFITKNGKRYSNATSGAKLSCEDDINRLYVITNDTMVASATATSSVLGINETVRENVSVSNLDQYNATLTSNETTPFAVEHFGTYAWSDSTIDDDWLASGSVSLSSAMAGHGDVVEMSGSLATLVLNIGTPQEEDDYILPPDDNETHVLSMWMYMNNSADFSLTVSPHLFVLFNVTDGDVWYLNLTGGGIWEDTETDYPTGEWVYFEWAFNSTYYNITMSTPPTRNTVPLVIGAPMKDFPLALPVQDNYLDYLMFSSAALETGTVYVDTVNLDWYSNDQPITVGAACTWEPLMYFFLHTFTLQFDNATANYRNVYNLTINIEERQSGWTPGKIYALMYYLLPSFQIPLIFAVPDNNTGPVDVGSDLYGSMISENGTVDFIALYAINCSTPNNITIDVGGWFWRETSTFTFESQYVATSTVAYNNASFTVNVTVTNRTVVITTVNSYNVTVQYNCWTQTDTVEVETVVTLNIAEYIFAIPLFATRAQTFFGWRAVDLLITSVDFGNLTVDYTLSPGFLLFS